MRQKQVYEVKQVPSRYANATEFELSNGLRRVRMQTGETATRAMQSAQKICKLQGRRLGPYQPYDADPVVAGMMSNEFRLTACLQVNFVPNNVYDRISSFKIYLKEGREEDGGTYYLHKHEDIGNDSAIKALQHNVQINGVAYTLVDLTDVILPDKTTDNVFYIYPQTAAPGYCYREFYSSDILLEIDYIPAKEIDKNQFCIQNAMGGAGNYSVNAFTGKFTYVKPLFALPDERFPIETFLAFNGDCKMPENCHRFSDRYWKLNFQQYVYGDGEDYIYVDDYYRYHRFKKLKTALYYDTEGTGLLLKEQAGSLLITDDRSYELLFENGRLVKIIDRRGTTPAQLTVAYAEDGSLEKITDGSLNTVSVKNIGNSMTLTKPDGKSVSFTFLEGQLQTVSDEGGDFVTYTYQYKQKRAYLTFISSTKGEMISVDYHPNLKVCSVTEKVNNIVEKNYDLRYFAFNTKIGETKHAAQTNASTVYKTVRFSAKGEYLACYESDCGVLDEIEFRSQEDFRHYVDRLNGKKGSAGRFYRKGYEQTMNTVGSSVSDFILFDSQPVLQKGEAYTVFAQAEVKSFSKIENREPQLQLGFYSENDPNTPLATFEIDGETEGVQYFAARIEKKENIVGSAILSNCKASVTFSKIYLSGAPRNESYDCLNFGVGSSADYTNDGVAWHKLNKIETMSIGGETTKLLAEDWILNAENIARNATECVLWSEGLTEARMGSAATKVKLTDKTQTVEKALKEIRYARVTEQIDRVEFETMLFGTGDRFVTVKNATALDNENKVCYTNYDQWYRPVQRVDSSGVKVDYTYDAFGNLTKEKISNSAGNYIEREYSYGINGKRLVSDTETVATAKSKRSYEYNVSNGNLIRYTDAANNNTNYSYNDTNEYVTEVSAQVGGVNNANAFTYEKDLVKTLSHNGFGFEFVFDTQKRVKQVKCAGGNLFQRTYAYNADRFEDTVQTSYANGASSTVVYDRYGREVRRRNLLKLLRTDIYASAATDLNNITDSFESRLTVTSSSKLLKRIEGNQNIYYTYDDLGRLKKIVEDDGPTIEYTYNANGSVSQTARTVNGEKITETYTYRIGDAFNEDCLEKIVTEVRNGGTNVAVGTLQTSDVCDAFSRLTFRTRNMSTEAYTYYTYGADNKGTNNYVKNVGYRIGNITENDSYEYDTRGNIVKMTIAGKTSQYAYDGANRLIREDNAQAGKTWTYEYDAGGNIKTKKQYAYTTGTLGTAEKTMPYGYDSVKKDLLTSWNGISFQYDANQNPKSYKGAEVSFDRNNRLASYWNMNETQYTYSFEYDAEGNRISRSRTYGTGVTTYYQYENGRLISERQDSTILNYVYDQSGIAGFTYLGKLYTYRKNILGDVISVYQGTEEKARYAYDGWGNCAVVKNVGGIADLNPFRYRSYYYDTGTKLYYLHSRYYDPELGRFISGDNLFIVALLGSEIINGLNLNAYCFNNPISYIDLGGAFPSRNKGGHGKTGLRQNDPWLYDENGNAIKGRKLRELYNAQPNTPEGRKNRMKIKKQQKYLNDREHGERTMQYNTYSLPRVFVSPYEENANVTVLWTPILRTSPRNILTTPVVTRPREYEQYPSVSVRLPHVTTEQAVGGILLLGGLAAVAVVTGQYWLLLFA